MSTQMTGPAQMNERIHLVHSFGGTKMFLSKTSAKILKTSAKILKTSAKILKTLAKSRTWPTNEAGGGGRTQAQDKRCPGFRT